MKNIKDNKKSNRLLIENICDKIQKKLKMKITN